MFKHLLGAVSLICFVLPSAAEAKQLARYPSLVKKAETRAVVTKGRKVVATQKRPPHVSRTRPHVQVTKGRLQTRITAPIRRIQTRAVPVRRISQTRIRSTRQNTPSVSLKTLPRLTAPQSVPPAPAPFSHATIHKEKGHAQVAEQNKISWFCRIC